MWLCHLEGEAVAEQVIQNPDAEGVWLMVPRLLQSQCRGGNGGGGCGEEDRGLELSYWPESFRAPGVTISEKKQPVDLGLPEEDDEFEEFPAEDWAGLDEDEDAHVWEDNCDDDNVEDDFSNQLRAELEKHGYKMETS
ncbi:26S proteasome complex subunit SEM1 [Bubalus bubalis]|uniref:26S proteasome complex subunit SEM1 n=1 Tax=Bubalus bubalis TaxID=89462 RepID=UPI00042D0636|nr:26S proteasome complex subunit SEM1 [Bubalus bubalis]